MNTGQLQHDFNHFLEVLKKLVYFLGVFGHFGALMGASGVKSVQHTVYLDVDEIG